MKQKLEHTTRRWLEAERSGRERAAEIALARLFRTLPTPMPSPELALRTLERLGLRTESSRTPHWTFRWAVSVALVLSGLTSALYAPALVASLSARGALNWLIDLGAGILASASRFFANGYTLWEVIAKAGATATEVLATPQTLGLMLATALFGLATFRVLAGLVTVERSAHHA